MVDSMIEMIIIVGNIIHLIQDKILDKTNNNNRMQKQDEHNQLNNIEEI